MNDWSKSNVPGMFIVMQQRRIRANEMAQALGVSQGNVSDWKNGRAVPSKSIRNSICSILSISEEFLMTGKTDLLNEASIRQMEIRNMNEYNRMSAMESAQKEKSPVITEDDEAKMLRDYIMSLYDRLSDEDKAKMQEYAESLVLKRPNR